MNSIQLIGRLTADPELRYTAGGTPVCTVRLAVPRRPRPDDPNPAPVFVSVVSYAALAEAVANHMAQGRRVAVNGRLDYREWDTGDVRRSVHEVIARDVDFLDAPPKGDGNGQADVDQADALEEEPF